MRGEGGGEGKSHVSFGGGKKGGKPPKSTKKKGDPFRQLGVNRGKNNNVITSVGKKKSSQSGHHRKGENATHPSP